MIYRPNKFVGKRARLMGVKVSDLLIIGGISIGLFFITMFLEMAGLNVGWMYKVAIGFGVVSFFFLQTMDVRAKTKGKQPHPTLIESHIAARFIPDIIEPGNPVPTVTRQQVNNH